MKLVKTAYRRFREWQREPLHYKPLGSVVHCCGNCGQEYAGDFCPRCGQKSKAGRITWETVRSGMMDVIGLGGRSLPYSVWQLLWRPGYFISDYINGKWQVSFPPVKMLVIVALLVFFIGRLLFPEYWAGIVEDETVAVTSTGAMYVVDSAINWLAAHPEWGFLLIFSFLILPTWFVFRHSPRNPRHTLPQGFFIQVFMTTQFFLWLLIISLVLACTGVNVLQAWIISIWFIPVMLLMDYMQLFGYGWWGTLWRLVSAVLFLMLFLLLIVCIQRLVEVPAGYCAERHYRPLIVTSMFAFGLGMLVSLANVVNRRLWQVRGKLWSKLLPLLLFVAVVVCLIVLEIQKPGVILEAL